MIESLSGKLYTGIAKDIEKRFLEHAADPRKGAKFFRSDPPVRIVYSELYANRSEASKREAVIKKMTRQEKLQLIVK
jgi:putative endonuclease